LSNVVRIDDERIRDHLGQIVRGTVEETLNGLLEAEAERLCNAGRYERTEARRDTRAGSYPRKLHTRAGEVTLRVPKLRQQTFETAIIERYRRRESSVEEALIEMYLAGVSVRRVEDITEALWGTRVSPGTVSNLNKKIYQQIETWRNRPIEGEHPYIYLDGVVLKRSWAGEVRNVSLLVAIGVSADGFRKILGICEGAKEDKAGWSAFLGHLKQRGLAGVRLVTSDACLGLVESIAEFYPDAQWQRCVVHFYRNVFSHVPTTKVREVAAMLKAIHAQEDRDAAQAKATDVIAKLRAQRLGKAAELVEAHVAARRRGADLLRLPRPALATLAHQQTRSSGSFARSAGAPGWSAPSPMASQPSTWPRPGCATSPAPAGPPAATSTCNHFTRRPCRPPDPASHHHPQCAKDPGHYRMRRPRMARQPMTNAVSVAITTPQPWAPSRPHCNTR
jgi:transposase-like protein